MNEPNFRALCAELLTAVDGKNCFIDGSSVEAIDHLTTIFDRIEIALVTPPPEPLRPIPVSERLPEAEDCLGRPTESYDAGWCWVYVYESWSFSPVVFPMPHSAQPRVLLNRGTTHWLPHNAIPFPGENQ